MSKIETSDLVDIFKEEAKKKAKKDIKKEKKKEKKLEKKEDIEFKKLTKIKENKKEEKKEDVDKRNTSILAFLYDTMFGFFLVLLFFCTSFFIFLTIKDNVNKEIIIKSCLLGIGIFSYIISLITKKPNLKKFMSMVSSLTICGLMVYLLYLK